MSAEVRIGIAMSAVLAARFREVTQRLGFSQSKLMQATISCLSDAELIALMKRYDELKALEKELRKTADTDMLRYLRGKTADELKILLQAAKSAE